MRDIFSISLAALLAAPAVHADCSALFNALAKADSNRAWLTTTSRAEPTESPRSTALAVI